MTQRKGRTLALTVNELLESKRFQIAVDNFKRDPMFMKAILIELGKGCLEVGKNTVIRKYGKVSSLPNFEMIPYLRNIGIDDFNTFELFWALSPAEVALYTADPKGELTEEEKDVLFEKVAKQFGLETKTGSS